MSSPAVLRPSTLRPSNEDKKFGVAMPRKSTNLLKSLSKRLTVELFKNVRPVDTSTGTVLFSAGDGGDGLYLIETGLLKALVESPDGEERIVSLFGPGDIVGELAVIDGQSRSATVVAMQDSTCRFVTKERYEKFTAANPEFYRELVMILSMRLREADNALAAATFLPNKGRIAEALLELAEYVGERSGTRSVTLNCKIANADLAAMAGVARENVSRVLSEWRDRNLVTHSGRYYCIHDIAALEHEIELSRK